MSCISVTHTPIGGIYVTTQTIGGITVSASSVGGITVRMWQECATNIRVPYLEIEPEIVWVLNGWTSNDVYSNVTWNVE